MSIKTSIFMILGGLSFYLMSFLALPLLDFDLYKSTFIDYKRDVDLTPDRVSNFLFLLVIMPKLSQLFYMILTLILFRQKIWHGIIVTLIIFIVNYLFNFLHINFWINSKIYSFSSDGIPFLFTSILLALIGTLFFLKSKKEVKLNLSEKT
jgi:hypothetical protein